MKPNPRYSGKFVLRVGSDLHARLAAEARESGLSLNELCVRKLKQEAPSHRFDSLGLDGRFLDTVANAFPKRPLALIVFGSFARGDFTSGSDIDLLVVFGPGTRLNRSLYRHFDRAVDLSRFQYPLNPHLVSLPQDARDSGSLWLEVASDGVVVWEHGAEVSNFIREVKELIFSGQIRRKTAYGQPYWVQGESR